MTKADITCGLVSKPIWRSSPGPYPAAFANVSALPNIWPPVWTITLVSGFAANAAEITPIAVFGSVACSGVPSKTTTFIPCSSNTILDPSSRWALE